LKVAVPPFLVPSPGSITLDGWYLQIEEENVPMPEELEHWDYQTRMVLSAFLTLNENVILKECHLGPESYLGILVTASAEATSTEIVLAQVEVPVGWNGARALTIEVPGQHFARRLTITSQVVVTAAEPEDELAPSRPGSILWSSAQKTHLQGMGAQFPTYAEDFEVTRPKIGHAGWLVDIDTSDPHASFLSNVKLVLNSGRPEIQRLLKGARDPSTLQLLRILDVDVTRRIASAGLSMPEVLTADPDFDDLSVAGGLRASLSLLWPDVPIENLAHELRNDPGAFEARVQENRELFK
jgi:hypothetical protein